MLTFILVLLALLQLADYWTTYLVIENGGHEKNPVLVELKDMLTEVGIDGKYSYLVLAKAVTLLAIAIVYSMQMVFGSWYPVITFVFAGITGWYGWVVWNNIKVLQKLKVFANWWK